MGKDSVAAIFTPVSDSAGIAIKVPMIPAKYCPKALAKNHIPIIKPTILGGDNLVIADKPMGDRHNSPVVMKKYPIANQKRFTMPFSAVWAPTTNI